MQNIYLRLLRLIMPYYFAGYWIEDLIHIAKHRSLKHTRYDGLLDILQKEGYK